MIKWLIIEPPSIALSCACIHILDNLCVNEFIVSYSFVKVTTHPQLVCATWFPSSCGHSPNMYQLSVQNVLCTGCFNHCTRGLLTIDLWLSFHIMFLLASRICLPTLIFSWPINSKEIHYVLSELLSTVTCEKFKQFKWFFLIIYNWIKNICTLYHICIR